MLEVRCILDPLERRVHAGWTECRRAERRDRVDSVPLCGLSVVLVLVLVLVGDSLGHGQTDSRHTRVEDGLRTRVRVSVASVVVVAIDPIAQKRD